MINLVREGTTNTIAISPASASIYHDLASGSFELDITQDYDLSSASLQLTKLPPVPAGYYNNYLLFSVASSYIPSSSGFYTYELVEGIAGAAAIWSSTTATFGAADFNWDASQIVDNKRTIDEGRIKILSTDQPTYTSYVGGDQNGQYTTYHK